MPVEIRAKICSSTITLRVLPQDARRVAEALAALGARILSVRRVEGEPSTFTDLIRQIERVSCREH